MRCGKSEVGLVQYTEAEAEAESTNLNCSGFIHESGLWEDVQNIGQDLRRLEQMLSEQNKKSHQIILRYLRSCSPRRSLVTFKRNSSKETRHFTSLSHPESDKILTFKSKG